MLKPNGSETDRLEDEMRNFLKSNQNYNVKCEPLPFSSVLIKFTCINHHLDILRMHTQCDVQRISFSLHYYKLKVI